MRSEVGKLMLDNVFHGRANLNMAIVGKLEEERIFGIMSFVILPCWLPNQLIRNGPKRLAKPLINYISEGIKESAAPWGLICLRYEIRTMTMPPEIQRAMKASIPGLIHKRKIAKSISLPFCRCKLKRNARNGQLFWNQREFARRK
jgi:hypothetical protein